eukprot:11413128-Alexandrium_andersonii.AAC.1
MAQHAEGRFTTAPGWHVLKVRNAWSNPVRCLAPQTHATSRGRSTRLNVEHRKQHNHRNPTRTGTHARPDGTVLASRWYIQRDENM